MTFCARCIKTKIWTLHRVTYTTGTDSANAGDLECLKIKCNSIPINFEFAVFSLFKKYMKNCSCDRCDTVNLMHCRKAFTWSQISVFIPSNPHCLPHLKLQQYLCQLRCRKCNTNWGCPVLSLHPMVYLHVVTLSSNFRRRIIRSTNLKLDKTHYETRNNILCVAIQPPGSSMFKE